MYGKVTEWGLCHLTTGAQILALDLTRYMTLESILNPSVSSSGKWG